MKAPDLPAMNATDWIAAGLSVVPGLDHLFKGHLIPGVLLLFLLGPIYLLAVIWLVPRTFGLSLLLPAVFIAVAAVHAFHLPDVRQTPGVRKQAQLTLARWTGRSRENPRATKR